MKKEKKEKVYIVTSGEYSDYRINGVFKDKKRAEQYAETATEMRVEEYEIDNVNERFIKNNVYSVLMDNGGNVKYIDKMSSWLLNNNFQSRGWFVEEDASVRFIGGKQPGDFEAYVLAKNEKHAIKIAGELKLQKSIEKKNYE